MRNYIYLDNKISDEQYKAWKLEFKSFMKEHLGVTPTFQLKKINFSNYPTYIDSDGDVRPKLTYLKELTKQAYTGQKDYAYDHIFMFVHRDNWRSDGIWGTNYSYSTGNIHLHYCRWDNKNMANTFGTSYHEWAHSPDALCKVETGVTISGLVFVDNYDRDFTHGGSQRYDYIRHKENTDGLKLMRPYVQAAYKERQEKHIDLLIAQRDNLLVRTVNLLKRKLRILLNKKNGVSA